MRAGRGVKEMQWSQSTEGKITFNNQVKHAPTGILPGEACMSHLWSRDPGPDELIFVCFCLRRSAFILCLLKCVYKRAFVFTRASKKVAHISPRAELMHLFPGTWPPWSMLVVVGGVEGLSDKKDQVQAMTWMRPFSPTQSCDLRSSV